MIHPSVSRLTCKLLRGGDGVDERGLCSQRLTVDLGCSQSVPVPYSDGSRETNNLVCVLALKIGWEGVEHACVRDRLPLNREMLHGCNLSHVWSGTFTVAVQVSSKHC